MKNEKVCISKSVGIFAVVGLVLIGLVLLMGGLANKPTSTSTRADEVSGTKVFGGFTYGKSEADCTRRQQCAYDVAISAPGNYVYLVKNAGLEDYRYRCVSKGSCVGIDPVTNTSVSQMCGAGGLYNEPACFAPDLSPKAAGMSLQSEIQSRYVEGGYDATSECAEKKGLVEPKSLTKIYDPVSGEQVKGCDIYTGNPLLRTNKLLRLSSGYGALDTVGVTKYGNVCAVKFAFNDPTTGWRRTSTNPEIKALDLDPCGK